MPLVHWLPLMASASPGKPQALVALGGNIGDVLAHFRYTRDALQAHDLIDVVRLSPVYRSAALGPPQDDYLNAVIMLQTSLPALGLLDVLQAIEQQCQRRRLQHWGPRTLDLDIIDYAGCQYQDERLILPHPQAHHRRFVLQPLRDIAPSWQHPVFACSPDVLLQKVLDQTLFCVHDCW